MYNTINEADVAFRNVCSDILNFGFSSEGQEVRPQWADGAKAYTIKSTGTIVNRYDLRKGFPILSLRPVNLKKAIDEILWIYQMRSNNVFDLNSHIWDSWADNQGSIGKAYGYQIAKRDSSGENQMDAVLRQLKETPYSRRIITNMLNHSENREMGLHPCAYSVTYNVVDGYLNMTLNQRSLDIFVAYGWNVAQYAALCHVVAHVCDLKVGELVHVITDAHIYDRHIPMVDQMLNRPSGHGCKLRINPKVKDFYKITVDDFELVGYEPGEQFKNIPVAV